MTDCTRKRLPVTLPLRARRRRQTGQAVAAVDAASHFLEDAVVHDNKATAPGIAFKLVALRKAVTALGRVSRRSMLDALFAAV